MGPTRQNGRTPQSELHPTAPRIFAALVFGLFIGFAGTATHRNGDALPWGLMLAAAMCAAVSVFVRAAFSRQAVAVFTLSAFGTVLALTYGGMAGDVLVTGQRISTAWLVLAPFSTFLGWFAPKRWFVERTDIESVPVQETALRRKVAAPRDGADDGSITAS